VKVGDKSIHLKVRSMTALPVSCYIRTLNEARLLGKVIAAVRDFVDEIVVVDSGSTDATIAIAQAAGARVIHQAWLGNGRQKRFGEDQCRNDFVLDLDADEVVSPELGAEIRALFAAGPPPLPIYELRLVTVPPVGKSWANIAVRYSRKLYDRRVVRAPDHKAWDQFDVPPGIKVGRLAGDLLHYSFRDLAQLVQKANRSSTNRGQDGRQIGRAAVIFRVLFALPFYFLKHYLERGLWRAGIYGMAVAVVAAYGRWLRDAKMYEKILARDLSQRERHALGGVVSNAPTAPARGAIG
jgi:glycosyltransferase involved in cell wall biosynthesis